MILVTRFLERKWVIQLFGLGLIVAPFANFFIQFLVLNANSGVTFRFVNISKYFLSGTPTHYILAAGSLVIGAIMLSGSTKAWKAVLCLVGTHLLLQIINYKSKEWRGPLGWSAFAVNISIFLFIADQLVWRIKTKAERGEDDKTVTPQVPAAVPAVPVVPVAVKPALIEEPKPVVEPKVIQLKSYKKILFSFGSDRPWGRLTTLTSQQLIVTSFTEAPGSIENKIVQMNFTKNLVIDIKFDRKESNLYYFTPLNMTPERTQELNQWLKKIAV